MPKHVNFFWSCDANRDDEKRKRNLSNVVTLGLRIKDEHFLDGTTARDVGLSGAVHQRARSTPPVLWNQIIESHSNDLRSPEVGSFRNGVFHKRNHIHFSQ